MSYSKADLRKFLEQVAPQTIHVSRPVDPSSQVAALCSETTRPLLLNNIEGFPGFAITDCLTRFRDTQALALGIEGGPGAVIPGYVAKLAPGARPHGGDRQCSDQAGHLAGG